MAVTDPTPPPLQRQPSTAKRYLDALRAAQRIGDQLDGPAFQALFPAHLQLGDIIVSVEEFLR